MGQSSSSSASLSGNDKDVSIGIDTSSSICTDDNPTNASIEEELLDLVDTHDTHGHEEDDDFVDPSVPINHDKQLLLELDDDHGNDDDDDADGVDSTASVAGFTTRSSTLSTDWNSDAKDETVDTTATPPSAAISSPASPLSPVKTLSSLSDVLYLPNKEIKERIQCTHVSIESLKEANAAVLEYNLAPNEDAISWYHDNNAAKKHNICATHTASTPSTPQRPLSPAQAQLRAQAQEEYAKTHMEFALFVLKISPSLKSIRFKMVPAKLSECNFWNAVFYLLLTLQEQLCIRDQALMPDCNTNGTLPQANGINAENGHQVHQLLVNKNQEIVRLQQHVLQLREELAIALQSQCHQSKEDSNKVDVHSGKWSMEKESIEFLALDEEIKSKLRDGKQQRLRDVQEQMKFILDSDAAIHSRGKWDCCGNGEYASSCAC